MIVIQIQYILESFLEGLRRKYTSRKSVFDCARRRQAIRENPGGLLGIGVLCPDLFISAQNEGPMSRIAIEKLLEGERFCTISREVLITL